MIGADGPRSKVRAAVGIDVDGLGSLGNYMSVTFRADLTRRLGRSPSAINAVTTPGAEGLFVPTSAHDRWIFAREWHPQPGETLTDWTSERIITLLRAGTGLPDLTPEITAVMPFEMAGHLATTFRAGPAFLVGDAAHRTTPVGGTGMNTAIHGAHNLGWKLASVLRGWAGDSLLDSYQPERRPIGEANVRRSLLRGPQPPANGLAWDTGVRYTSPVIASGLGTGQRAPHVWVDYRGTRISTLDLFDGQLTLLTGPSSQPWRRATERFTAQHPACPSSPSPPITTCPTMQPDRTPWPASTTSATAEPRSSDPTATSPGIGPRPPRTRWKRSTPPSTSPSADHRMRRRSAASPETASPRTTLLTSDPVSASIADGQEVAQNRTLTSTPHPTTKEKSPCVPRQPSASPPSAWPPW